MGRFSSAHPPPRPLPSGSLHPLKAQPFPPPQPVQFLRPQIRKWGGGPWAGISSAPSSFREGAPRVPGTLRNRSLLFGPTGRSGDHSVAH